VPIQGFLEDYVFVIQALFDLYEASLEQGWLEWALQLQHTQDKLFWDPEGAAYFSSEAGDSSLLLRLKDGEPGDTAVPCVGCGAGGQGRCRAGGPSRELMEEALSPTDQDGAEPTPNSVAVTNLLRAASYSGHMEWVEKAGQILAAFSERLQKIPVTLPEMARATAVFHHTLKQVWAGARTSPAGPNGGRGPGSDGVQSQLSAFSLLPPTLSLDRSLSAGTPEKKTPRRCCAASTPSSARTR